MSQIPSVSPLDPAFSRQPSDGFSAIKTEDFIRIIFAELANQDPFSPNDSAALLDQLNSIRSIESDIDLMEQLQALVFENKLAAAANLIGKRVAGLTAGFERVSGTVVSVIREGRNVTLELENGIRLPLESLELIEEVTG